MQQDFLEVAGTAGVAAAFPCCRVCGPSRTVVEEEEEEEPWSVFSFEGTGLVTSTAGNAFQSIDFGAPRLRLFVGNPFASASAASLAPSGTYPPSPSPVKCWSLSNQYCFEVRVYGWQEGRVEKKYFKIKKQTKEINS